MPMIVRLLVRDPESIASFLSSELSACQSWLVDNRLSLHVGKTECILFGTKKRVGTSGDFIVTCGGEVVKRVTSVNYLGILLDQCMNFNDHVSLIFKKANSRLSFLYRYASLLDPQTRKLLCSSLIAPNLEYCSSAWYPGLGSSLRNRFDIIQRKMVRYIKGWGPREHVGEEEINSVGWVIFPKRVSFFKLNHVFKIRLGLAPRYLSEDFCPINTVHSHRTRNSMAGYTVNVGKYPVGTFHYSSIREWNALPDNVKGVTNLPLFKHKLKLHFSS